MRDVLLISPHCDDAAYSIAGLLLSGKLDPSRCLLVSLFTTSAYAPYATVKGVAEISKLRRLEEKHFVRVLGLKWLDLKGMEAPLRLGINVERVFDADLRTDVPTTTEMAVAELCRAYPWRLCVAPLGVGGHIDHRVARCWAEQYAAMELWFYEDLPYAGELEAALDRNLLSLTAGLSPEIIPNNGWLEAKLGLLRGYASQVSIRDLESVKRSTQQLNGERIWRQK